MYIEENGYSKDKWRKHFPVESLLKLLVVKAYKKISYRKVISSLSEKDCLLLSFPYDPETGLYMRPSKSTLHDFAKTIIGIEGLNRLMIMVGKKIVDQNPGQDGIIDSTPLEASRYSEHSKYNPHYEIKMDKAHIFHYGNSVLYMVHSEGMDHDEKHYLPLILAIKEMDPSMSKFMLDAGYKGFQTHADCWYHLGVQPLIGMPCNAVYSEDATLEKKNEKINKMWKIGGNIHDSLPNKLKFLYENGYAELVGKFLRNKNMNDPDFENKMKNHGDCERKHSHIKSTVKFDVKGYWEDSREFNAILNFVCFQLLDLSRLQCGIKNPEFCNYY